MGRSQLCAPSSPARQTDVGSTRIWSAEQNCRWCVDNYKQIGRAIALQKRSQILSAFRVLKRQVDDSETVRQLAATGQDRATVVVSANLLRDTKTPLRGECKKKNWRRYQIIPGAHDQ